MPLKDKRGLLIANARAGKQGAKLLLYPIVEGLAPEYTLTVHMTEGPGDARATAMQAEGFDALFVSGGDGTVNGAVSGLVEAGLDIPVGYYPSGTANDLAATLVPDGSEPRLRIVTSSGEKTFLWEEIRGIYAENGSEGEEITQRIAALFERKG